MMISSPSITALNILPRTRADHDPLEADIRCDLRTKLIPNCQPQGSGPTDVVYETGRSRAAREVAWTREIGCREIQLSGDIRKISRPCRPKALARSASCDAGHSRKVAHGERNHQNVFSFPGTITAHSVTVPLNTGTQVPPTLARTPSSDCQARINSSLRRPISCPWTACRIKR